MVKRFDETAQTIKEHRNAKEIEEKLSKLKDGQVVLLRPENINSNQNIREEIQLDNEFYQLVESIKEVGILQPIVVTVAGSEILCVSGHRRLMAAKELNMERVQCLIKIFDNISKKDLAQLVENLNRSSLKPLDIAERMLTLKRAGYKQSQLEDIFDRNRATIGRFQKMASWPEPVKKMIRESNKFSTRSLLAIASKRLTDEEVAKRIENVVIGDKPRKEASISFPKSRQAWNQKIESFFASNSFTKSENAIIKKALADLGLMSTDEKQTGLY